MFATFDQLAEFSDENKTAENSAPPTSAVDMSAIINRLNDLEQKINALIVRGNETAERQEITETRAETEKNESEGNNNAD